MLLSIIVPVYNTSKYLKRCLDSIINAHIDNSEIIVINDGSTDNSEEIIKEYQKKYSFIKYISKQNEGLGATKNLGLKEANGKYISFIDSDDSIDNKFYSDALPYLENNYDIIVYDFLSYKNGEKFITYAKDPMFEKLSDFEGILYTTIMPSSCNKIVKKSLYTRNNLLFPEHLKYEDLATTPILLLSAKKIKYIPLAYYNYFINNESIMHKKTNKINYDMSYIIKILEKRLQKFINYNKEQFEFYTYMWRIEDFLLYPIYSLRAKKRFKYIAILYKNNGKLFKKLNKNKLLSESIYKNFNDEQKKFILKRNRLLASNRILSFNYFLFRNSKKEKIFSIDNNYYI